MSNRFLILGCLDAVDEGLLKRVSLGCDLGV